MFEKMAEKNILNQNLPGSVLIAGTMYNEHFLYVFFGDQKFSSGI